MSVESNKSFLFEFLCLLKFILVGNFCFILHKCDYVIVWETAIYTNIGENDSRQELKPFTNKREITTKKEEWWVLWSGDMRFKNGGFREEKERMSDKKDILISA